MPRQKPTRPTGNHLLDRLPPADCDRLLADADRVTYPARHEVYRVGAGDEPVYFPTAGVYTLLLPLKDGDPVEVGVVDSEGMLGIPCALGMPTQPLRAVTHTEAACVRVPGDRFLAAIRSSDVLDALVRRFAAVSWQAATQNIACALRHTVRERTCRWLLAVHDRAATDEFEVTHERLAEMIGASRQKVTAVAKELQRAGHISYQRGRVRVVDRAGLESVGCECYRVLKQAYLILTT